MRNKVGKVISFPVRGSVPTYSQTVNIALQILDKECSLPVEKGGNRYVAQCKIPTWAKDVVKEAKSAIA
jgi:hypothetical protein